MQLIRKPHFEYLLFSILSTLLVPPFFEGQLQSVVFHFTLSLVLVSGIFILGYKQKGYFLLIFLALVASILNWLDLYKTQFNLLLLLKIIFFTPYFIFLITTIFKQVMREKEVSEQTIFGGIAVYLMLGLTGALFFAGIEFIFPHSFNFTQGDVLQFQDFVYYSYITLSTVGYGDVTPATSKAQALSVTLSITGQIYLTVMIAILVGKYANRAR